MVPKLKNSATSAILSAVYVVVVTIWSENSAALKGWLTDFSGHHWVSKSIVSLAIYFGGLLLFYFLPKKIGDDTIKKYLKALLLTTFLGAVIIFVFYVGHYLHWF